MLYIIYGLIILITIILYFLVEDKKEYLSKLGKTTIISGIITISLGLSIKLFLSTFLNNFNIVKISSLVFEKFIYNSIILLVIGIVEIIISKLLSKKIIYTSSNK